MRRSESSIVAVLDCLLVDAGSSILCYCCFVPEKYWVCCAMTKDKWKKLLSTGAAVIEWLKHFGWNGASSMGQASAAPSAVRLTVGR